MLAQITATTVAQLNGGVNSRVQLVAVIVSVILLAFVLELVRRRQLVERYALIWMLATVALLVLAIWRGLLGELADLLGIAAPPNALFLIALGLIVLLLLSFSVSNSRLGEETKILAQEVARLDQQVRELAGEKPARNGSGRPERDTEAASEAESQPESEPAPEPGAPG